jgi:UbiD family decarboxylase
MQRLVEVVETALPPTAGKLWQARDLATEALRVGTKRVRRGPVLDRVESPGDLSALPALRTWPDDGGPFLTLPLVYSEHPETGGGNLGIYRMQVHDPTSTGMHWQIGKGGGFHYEAAESRGESLPVTVFLGGPPALILAAIAPFPENVSELMLASLIAGGRLPTVQGPGPHRLVAACEFALVGSVEPALRQPEGPFGDHYGYYSLEHDYPVFRLEHLAHRRDAIFPATVVGKPRQEDAFIGDLLQELLSPLFPIVMPAVKKIWSYAETGYHSLAAAIVKERYARESLASALRILGEGQLSLTKFLLVTDGAVDLRDFRATLMHILSRTRPETDLYILGNSSMDTLDYTGPVVNEGSKGIWLGLGDPIRSLPGEFSAAELPVGVRRVEVFCPGCLIVEGPSKAQEPELGDRLAKSEAFQEWPLVVLSDEAQRAARSSTNFLWTTFTRFEPAADISARRRELVRNHVAFVPPVVIDARLRADFPDELSCRPDIAERVSDRWSEYFPDGGVEMGDSERAHLD